MPNKKTKKLLRTVKTKKIVRSYLDSKKKTGVKLAKATKRTIKSSPEPIANKKETLLEGAKKLIVDPIKKNIKRGYKNILKNPFKSSFADSKKERKKL